MRSARDVEIERFREWLAENYPEACKRRAKLGSVKELWTRRMECEASFQQAENDHGHAALWDNITARLQEGWLASKGVTE